MARKRLSRRFEERLNTMANHLQCPQHHTPLVCVVCDIPDDQLTGPEWVELESLLGRLGVLKDQPRLAGPHCRRCASELLCWRCNELSGEELTASDGLSADDRVRLEALLRRLLGNQSWILE